MKMKYLLLVAIVMLSFQANLTHAQCTDPRTGRDVECPVNAGETCTDPRTGAVVACPDSGDKKNGVIGGSSVSIQNPLKAKSITAFFIDLIEVVLVFAMPLIVFFIILAGFKYVMARGNPTKITEANQALLYAIIGGVLILGAFVILQVIQGTIDAITI